MRYKTCTSTKEKKGLKKVQIMGNVRFEDLEQKKRTQKRERWGQYPMYGLYEYAATAHITSYVFSTPPLTNVFSQWGNIRCKAYMSTLRLHISHHMCSLRLLLLMCSHSGAISDVRPI